MGNKKKPAIRFKGFTDDWEQRKLGEVFEEYSEKEHDELPALMIVQGGGTVRRDESDRNLAYDKTNLSNYKMVRDGDFIVHLRSFEGGLEMATNTGIISPAYHTFHGENTDSKFYYSYFRSKKFIDTDLKPHVYGIRDGRSIDIEGMKTVRIPYASFEEQKVIGKYIEILDHLITLHQRKYDKLCVMKKSMLEKMFPKNGEKVPEVRFKGFTDDWEQRKLGAFISECTERTSNFEQYPLYSLTIESGITEKTERYERSFLVTKKEDLFKIVPPKCFVTNPMNLRFGAIGYNPKLQKISVSGYYDVFSIDDSECSEFWQAYLKTYTSLKKYDDVATGSLIEKRRVHFSELKKIDFLIPVELEEKQKIGAYFHRLDHLITLHQRELEKLKNIKKSMLEKMFV